MHRLLAPILLILMLLAARSSADAAPRVQLTTSVGVIVLELDPVLAPKSVANFLALVDDAFYDGLIFHRVMANFVIQAGGYDRDMNYREPPRTVPNEAANGLLNYRGSVAMARLDDPDSADAQFFINVNDNSHLDRTLVKAGYTVFGRVVAGMDVVTEIELVETGIVAGMAGVPIDPIVILSARRVEQAE